jgi:hypothetical protein
VSRDWGHGLCSPPAVGLTRPRSASDDRVPPRDAIPALSVGPTKGRRGRVWSVRAAWSGLSSVPSKGELPFRPARGRCGHCRSDGLESRGCAASGHWVTDASLRRLRWVIVPVCPMHALSGIRYEEPPDNALDAMGRLTSARRKFMAGHRPRVEPGRSDTGTICRVGRRR